MGGGGGGAGRRAQGAGRETYHGDDLGLDDGREGDQLKVEGEVELQTQVRGQRDASKFACSSGADGATYGAHEERDGDGLLCARHGCCFRTAKKGRQRVWALVSVA